jgi:hypothetical protein
LIELSSPPALGISMLWASSGDAEFHLSRDPSVSGRTRSGSGSRDHPPHATFDSSGPMILNDIHPTSAYPATRHRRRRFFIALLAILIAAGAFFAAEHHKAIDMNDSRPKLHEPAMNASGFFSSDTNSSEFSAVNDASLSPAHNASRAGIRSSCSYYSCSSCTYWEGCGWCVPSQRCSSGEQYFTYDEMCSGGRARIDWVWYSSDCVSRCPAGFYSSTGYVC